MGFQWDFSLTFSFDSFPASYDPALRAFSDDIDIEESALKDKKTAFLFNPSIVYTSVFASESINSVFKPPLKEGFGCSQSGLGAQC